MMATHKHSGEEDLSDVEVYKTSKKYSKKDTTSGESENNQNLIPCKDCSKPISKNAESCPNCGVKIKKEISAGEALLKIFGAILLLYALYRIISAFGI